MTSALDVTYIERVKVTLQTMTEQYHLLVDHVQQNVVNIFDRRRHVGQIFTRHAAEPVNGRGGSCR